MYPPTHAMGTIPIPIPKAEPMDTRTHDTWVQVQTGMGTGTLKFTHGLPVSNTSHTRASIMGGNVR